MKFSEWLDAKNGRTKAVAEHFDVSLGAVTQWRIAVPRGRMRELHAFIDGAVGYEEMIPDAGALSPCHAKADSTPGAHDTATPLLEVPATTVTTDPAMQAELDKAVQAGLVVLPKRTDAWDGKTERRVKNLLDASNTLKA